MEEMISERLPADEPPPPPPPAAAAASTQTTPRWGVLSAATSTPLQQWGSPFSTPQSTYKTAIGAAGATTPHKHQIRLLDGTSLGNVSPIMRSENICGGTFTKTPSADKNILSSSSSKAQMASGGTPKTSQPSTGEEVEFPPVAHLSNIMEDIIGEEEEDTQGSGADEEIEPYVVKF